MKTALGNLFRVCLLAVVSGAVLFPRGWGQWRAAVVVPPASLPAARYAEWAHHHWVWLSNDRATQKSMMDYAKEYLAYGIEVGAVDIDSGWSTGFNNFIFNTEKYPNATEMVEFFHSRGIRVILWATSMVDNGSSKFQEAYDRQYFIKNVLGQQAMLSWWHGKGGLIDYSNPDAKEWWHQQMDNALSYGIDGWKCDGTDPFILELVLPLGRAGLVTRRDYSDAYYGDFFDYTREKLGSDRLIMSRPVDGYGPLYLDFSPRRVMLSGWVGDQDPTFEGLENALKRYLQSAWAGYANFGSDIGGYRGGGGGGRSKELFLRWAQLGAFSPLMENGGNGEHRPWLFDSNNHTLNIYKKFVDVHYQLIPYLLTTGSEALDNNRSSITPLAKHESFINKLIDAFKPATYNYLLGPDILVAPILSNTSTAKVVFPAGSDWVCWWDHSTVYAGGASLTLTDVPLEEYPVFSRNGSVIPLRVTQQATHRGELLTGLAGYLRWALHSPTPTQNTISTSVREFEGPGIVASYWWPTAHDLVFTVSAHPSIRSVLEVTGLPAPVKAVQIQAQNKTFLPATHVHSVKELTGHRLSGAAMYYQSEHLPSSPAASAFYTVLVHPGGNSEDGHAIHINFL